MTTKTIERSEPHELNADDLELVSGGWMAAVAGAIKLASAIADATGGPIDIKKVVEWARNRS
jgi:hypothetical protein